MERQLILEKLYDLAKDLNVSILYAVEIGSRAYKVSHSDSDFDIGIIYKHQINNYLKLERPKESFHMQLTNKMEVHGWDIYKVSTLLLKSNSSLYEWLKSDIVYKKAGNFVSEIQAKCLHNYSLLKLAMHYQQMAVRNSHQYKDKRTNKLLFQIARCYLAAKWIISEKSHPPIIFLDLLKQNLSREELNWFHEIYRVKSMKQQLSIEEKFLLKYLDDKLKRMFPTIKALPNDKIALADINELILKELIKDD